MTPRKQKKTMANGNGSAQSQTAPQAGDPIGSPPVDMNVDVKKAIDDARTAAEELRSERAAHAAATAELRKETEAMKQRAGWGTKAMYGGIGTVVGAGIGVGAGYFIFRPTPV